jgi:hypothetical protein
MSEKPSLEPLKQQQQAADPMLSRLASPAQEKKKKSGCGCGGH